MKKTVGGTDKLIRIILSMMVMGYGFYDPSFWWLFIPGVILLFTAISSICPLYSLLGVSTCEPD
ncbi:MAG: DUF2892 domain-containing protein [Gammaproteobacteria bacterium]|nr:DUF2892 domain-containing protein [Gammaproteobacteria bacterium]